MKQKSLPIITLGLMSLCFVLSGTNLLAQSDGSDTGPVSMTASLAGSSTICVGEPILLKYVVTNSSELPATVSSKRDKYDQEDKYDTLGTESFTEVGDKPLVPSASLLVPHHTSDTLKLMDGVDLTGNSSRSWEVLANAGITFPHAGSYILRVHVERPYVSGSREQGERFVLSGDYAFPLKVVAANPAYLHSMAEHLRGRILKTPEIEARATLIQALFSMPEASAASSWQALVEEPKLDGTALNEITTSLADLQTIKAVDLLAEIIWNPVQPSASLDEAMPSQRLDEMYDASDPTVKKHIDDLTAQHKVAGAKKFKIE